MKKIEEIAQGRTGQDMRICQTARVAAMVIFGSAVLGCSSDNSPAAPVTPVATGGTAGTTAASGAGGQAGGLSGAGGQAGRAGAAMSGAGATSAAGTSGGGAVTTGGASVGGGGGTGGATAGSGGAGASGVAAMAGGGVSAGGTAFGGTAGTGGGAGGMPGGGGSSGMANVPVSSGCDAPGTIFMQSCVDADGLGGCHTPENEGARAIFAVPQPDIVGLMGTNCARLVIDPANPDESLMLIKLRALAEGEEIIDEACGADMGGDPMPARSLTPLSDDDMACVRDWIAGFAN